MAPVTEIAYLPLKAGQDPTDANSPAGSLMQEILNAVLEQEGAQRAYWSFEFENPSMLRLFIDWDSLDHHTKFNESGFLIPEITVLTAARVFKSFVAKVVDGDPTVYHASMTPHPASMALSNKSSPVTEWLTLYISATDTSAQERLEHDSKELVKIIEEHGEGYIGSAAGWVVEELPLPHDPNTKSKAWVTAIGWQSIEHHHTYTNTQQDKYQHLLEGATYLQGMTVCHVSCVEVVPQKG